MPAERAMSNSSAPVKALKSDEIKTCFVLINSINTPIGNATGHYLFFVVFSPPKFCNTQSNVGSDFFVGYKSCGTNLDFTAKADQ